MLLIKNYKVSTTIGTIRRVWREKNSRKSCCRTKEMKEIPNKLKFKCMEKTLSCKNFFFLLRLPPKCTSISKQKHYCTKHRDLTAESWNKKTAAFLMANPIFKMDLQYNRNCMLSIDFINLM